MQKSCQNIQGHDRKGRVRPRPGKIKCRRSPTRLPATLRQRRAQLNEPALNWLSPIANRQSPATDAKQRPGFPITNYLSRQSDSNRRPADYKFLCCLEPFCLALFATVPIIMLKTRDLRTYKHEQFKANPVS